MYTSYRGSAPKCRETAKDTAHRRFVTGAGTPQTMSPLGTGPRGEANSTGKTLVTGRSKVDLKRREWNKEKSEDRKKNNRFQW